MESPLPTEFDAVPPVGGYQNIHGRRAGRGLRPVLIVLKLLFVCMFIGGLVAVFVGVALAPQPLDVPAWRIQSALLARLYVFAIVPGLTAALVCGTLLAASIWRVMIRMRWLQLKVLIVVLAMPALHLFMESRSVKLHKLLAQASPDLTQAATLRDQMLAGTLTAFAVGVLLLVLGRVKPRLGQGHAKTFSKSSA